VLQRTSLHFTLHHFLALKSNWPSRETLGLSVAGRKLCAILLYCCMGGVSVRVLYCVSGEALALSCALSQCYSSSVPASILIDQWGYLHPSGRFFMNGLI